MAESRLHDWHRGVLLLDAQLSTCRHCGVLRVERPGRLTQYLLPGFRTTDRVRILEPACLPRPVEEDRRGARS